MTAPRLDLGSGHWLEFTSWAPDYFLNPRYADLPEVSRWGAIIWHELRPDDSVCAWRGECAAAITFAGEVQRQVIPDAVTWTVESWEPLTLSASLLCHCGDHGFIRDGRWVSAL